MLDAVQRRTNGNFNVRQHHAMIETPTATGSPYKRAASETNDLADAKRTRHHGQDEVSAEDMLARIFQHFDLDCDGYWNEDELNGWGEFCQGCGILHNDYLDLCAYIEEKSVGLLPVDSARGLSLEHVRIVYSMEEHDQVALDNANETRTKARKTSNGRLHRDFEKIVTETPRTVNLRFYLNLAPYPGGMLIDEWHQRWRGDFYRLEHAHDYIQWLFPSPENSSYNNASYALTDAEAKVMRQHESVKQRFVTSLEIMLDFFGFALHMDAAGDATVTRKDHSSCTDCLHNLSEHPHNFLRISRILKCLASVGLQKFQLPLLRALAVEVYRTQLLAGAADSLENHWLPALTDPAERQLLDNEILMWRRHSEDCLPARDTTEYKEEPNGNIQLQKVEIDAASHENGHLVPLNESTSAEMTMLTGIDHVQSSVEELSTECVQKEGPLSGAHVFIDTDGFEVDDIPAAALLESNGALVVKNLDLQACTHVLCDRTWMVRDGERVKTDAIATLESSHDSDTIACNNRWLQACLRSKRMLPVDLKVDHRYLPHSALPLAEATAQLLPSDYVDFWDDDHVKLPCSPRYLIDRKFSKWSVICTKLRTPIRDLDELIESIAAMSNSRFREFSVLEQLFASQAAAGHPIEGSLSPSDADEFFRFTLPAMAELALELPDMVKDGLLLLRRRRKRKIELPQRTVACLLTHAFFCTFPARSRRQQFLPGICFGTLFQDLGSSSWGSSDCRPQLAKLRCLLNYFSRVTKTVPTGKIQYSRQVGDTDTDWTECQLPLVPLKVCRNGKIEDANGVATLQIDFANKVIGGGVLGHGTVQEEIRFVINPECILARLFTETLMDDEAVLICGAERFSNYSGYAASFRFASDHVDNTPTFHQSGLRATMIVAMDAMKFERQERSRQYFPRECCRELNKALAAFTIGDDADRAPALHPHEGEVNSADTALSRQRTVATGNWGCGVFGGDKLHKAILQAMAATVAQRPAVWYFTLGHEPDSAILTSLFEAIAERELKVADLWALLIRFSYRVEKAVAADEPADFEEFLCDEGLLPSVGDAESL
eukprot:SAG31_NODE_113_length_24342_cov_5.194530_15_plen_1060_part_00